MSTQAAKLWIRETLAIVTIDKLDRAAARSDAALDLLAKLGRK